MYVLFSFFRAPGRRGATEVRADVRADLHGAASLARAPTSCNLSRVSTPSHLIFLFWDVTLVSSDGAFPRSSIIDHCLILAFRIHLMLLWPVLILWFLTVICSGPHLREVLSQSYLSALRLPILGSQGQPAGNFSLDIHVSF